MTFDAHKNLAYSRVSAAPSPALSGTSLTVSPGQGALFPVAPFNCTVWPNGVLPLQSNAEIVRVTNVVGDTLTIARAQEGTTAKPIAVGYQIANTISAKVITDIEQSIIQEISAGTAIATASQVIFSNANGVTFGVAGQTITASVVPNTGGGSITVSAGTTSNLLGFLNFFNQNGLSFGLVGGTITASKANQPVAASASNGSFLFSTLAFSNANNVTFGTSAGSVITASVSPSAQTIQPVAASASDGSFLFSTLGFSNANGITFGTSAGSIITASVGSSPGQSTQPVAASASNGSFLFSTLAFSNANNVTFGTSAGSIITASVGAGAQSTQPVAASASNGSFLFSTLGFSNANNVTFGTSAGSIITASVGAGTQSTQPVAASASNGSFLFSTLAFSNANNVTFGTSAGSIITASVSPSAQTTQPVAASASNGSFLFSTLGFSNANNVTFGTSAGSIITASIANPAAAQATQSLFTNLPLYGSTSVNGLNGTRSVAVAFNLPYPISASFIRLIIQHTTNSTTLSTAAASMNASAEVYTTHNAVIYSVGSGASSRSLMSVASGSCAWTMQNSISVDAGGSQYSITQGISGAVEGSLFTSTTQYSATATNYSLTTNQILSNVSGTRFVDINFANSLSQGPYWLIYGVSTSSASNSVRFSNATNCNFGTLQVVCNVQVNFAPFPMGGANATSGGGMGNGSFSSGTGGTVANLPISAISTSGSQCLLYFQMIRSA